MISAAALISAFGATSARMAAAAEAALTNCTALYVDPGRPTDPVYTMDCSPWCPNPSPYVGTAGQKVMIAWCFVRR